ANLRLGRRLRLGLRSRFGLLPRLGRGLRIVGGGASNFGRFPLPRDHSDIERGAPVPRTEVAEIVFDLFGLCRWALLVQPKDGFAALVSEADCAEASFSGSPNARTHQLQAAVARAFGEGIEALVRHNLSTTCRMRPTRPPTSVPLMRIY